MRTPRGRRSGNAYLGGASLVVICGVLGAGVLLPNLGRYDDAVTILERERAFQLAEAAIDRGIVATRGLESAPAEPVSIEADVDIVGSYKVTLTSGATNRRDDDGDGETDERDESRFVALHATGTSGATSRRIEVLLAHAVENASLHPWCEAALTTWCEVDSTRE